MVCHCDLGLWFPSRPSCTGVALVDQRQLVLFSCQEAVDILIEKWTDTRHIGWILSDFL